MCSSFHQSLPGCNGLLLLVLDDFDDLLLVGRLLLPVKVKTGGIAEGGGTYNAKRKNSHIPFFCDAALIAVFLFFTRWLPFPAWWTDGLFPPSGGIEVPESHACAWWVKSKIRYIEVTRTESFLEGKGGEEKRTRRREKSSFSKPLTLLKKQRWTIKQRMDVWIYFLL